MDENHSQRAPDPGWTRVRIGTRAWQMPDPEWERWVRMGRIPPSAMILSLHWTRGVWRRAESLEVYHLFRPAAAEAAPAGVPPGPDTQTGIPAREPGLPRALWGSGISVTQVLVLANLLVSAALVLLWKENYSDRLWDLSGRLHAQLFRGALPVLFIPLFLHASSGHLLGNMVGLTAAGAAVEEFYGAARTILIYFVAGLCGAALSLIRSKPVLSVGASGAIMGLYGVILVFLLRNRPRFSEQERRKTARVYLPLLALALLPSLFQADLYSHVGGFAGGILAALVLAPAPTRLPWMRTG